MSSIHFTTTLGDVNNSINISLQLHENTHQPNYPLNIRTNTHPTYNQPSEMSPAENKDTTRVAAGLKAAINNPNVSEEAKDNAEQKLHQLGATSITQSNPNTVSNDEHKNRVLGMLHSSIHALYKY